MTDRREQQEAAATALELKRDGLRESTRKMLLDPDSRMVLWWILEQCGIYQVGPIGNSGTNVHQGERNVGLKIINQIESVEPTAYARLHLEMAQKRTDAARIKS